MESSLEKAALIHTQRPQAGLTNTTDLKNLTSKLHVIFKQNPYSKVDKDDHEEGFFGVSNP